MDSLNSNKAIPTAHLSTESTEMNQSTAPALSLNTIHARHHDSTEVGNSSRLGSLHPHQSSIEFHSNQAMQQLPSKTHSQHYQMNKHHRMLHVPSGQIQVQSYYSNTMNDPIMRLEESFRHAIDELLKDPLMDVFRNSRESQNFMLDRAEEIVMAAVKNSAVQMVNDLQIQLDICQQDLKSANEMSKMTVTPSTKSMQTAAKSQSQAVLIQGADLQALTVTEPNSDELTKLRAELESVQTLLAAETKQKEGLEADLNTARSQIDELSKEVQSLQLDERQKVYKQTLEERDGLNKQLKSATEKATQQENKLQQLKKENGSLFLTKTSSSRTWRKQIPNSRKFTLTNRVSKNN